MRFRDYLKYSLPLAAIVSLASRFYISADGYLYLSSARALFSPEFSTHYHWVREPLYPFFLWFIHNFFGAADYFYSLANLIVLAFAASFAAWSFNFTRKIFLYFILIVFINSITVGLAGSILQQTLLSALVLSLIPLIYRFDSNQLDLKSFSTRFKAITVTISSLGCLLSFLFIPVVMSVLLCNIFILIIFRRFLNKERIQKSLISKIQVRNAIVVTFVVILPFLSWSLVKMNYAEDTFGRFKPWIGSNDFLSSFEDPKVSKLQLIGGLTSISTDVGENTSYKSEIKIFGLGWPDTIQAEQCGFYNDGWPEINAYAKDYVTPTCKPDLLWKFFLGIQPFSLFLFRFFIVLSPFVLIYYVMRRKYSKALIYLPIITTFSVYFFFGMGISRYLYAIWPATVFFFLTLFERPINDESHAPLHPHKKKHNRKARLR